MLNCRDKEKRSATITHLAELCGFDGFVTATGVRGGRWTPRLERPRFSLKDTQEPLVEELALPTSLKSGNFTVVKVVFRWMSI
jgi:hypothetical protein